MDTERLKKPDNLDEESWRQHLQWVDVMSEQVEENFARHLARVREDADRCAKLLARHREAMRNPQSTRSLFDD